MLRVTAPNPGPMTLEGTNTYIVGAAPCWVIDPGPADESHVAAIRDAAESRGGIEGVVLTHSHADHAAAVPLLGAPLVHGEVDERDETSAAAGPVAGGEASRDFRPDSSASRKTSPPTPPAGKAVGPFEVLSTPGHAADHVAFRWGEVVFCGDLVLGTGSSIVPPRELGGSLADVMDSLERVRALGPELLCPGHGPWIGDPGEKLAEYIAHRNEREQKLVAALDAGERDPERLLDAAWDDVPDAMRPAAALAMRAHLEKLADEGRLPAGVEP